MIIMIFVVAVCSDSAYDVTHTSNQTNVSAAWTEMNSPGTYLICCFMS